MMSFFTILPSVAVFSAFVTLSAAAPTKAALTACDQIQAAGIGINEVNLLNLSSSVEYERAREGYWSAANADLYPACVVTPSCADQVSTIVKILLENPSVPFATKAGGHNANVGWSSVNNGVLIWLDHMKNTTLSKDHQTADVQPGSLWGEAMKALEPYNVAVVGGRLAGVGVGGLVLGGGLSHLSSQYGFACDNIVNYEIVLANGTITNASKQTNTDLYFALTSGGGNNFGIVTKYTMKTHPVGQFWGGTKVYSGIHTEALINATQDFTENYHDPKAAIITTCELIGNTLDICVMFYSYDGPVVPKGVFDKFDAIEGDDTLFIPSLGVSSYAELLHKNDEFNIRGARYLIRGTTIPNLPAPVGKDLYIDHYRRWKKIVQKDFLLHPDFIQQIGFQPMPKAIVEASHNAGGSGLHQNVADGDKMFMQYTTSWYTAAEDKTAHNTAIAITNDLDSYVREKYPDVNASNSCEGTNKGKYTPIFMNDAMYDQKPLQSYGAETYARMKTVRDQVDPGNFFVKRTGGFKFT